MSDTLSRYSHLTYRFHLPYRVFLDDGVYFVANEGVMWRVTLTSVPRTVIPFTTPTIDFGARAQLHLDNHGYSGVTEVASAFPLVPPLTNEQVWARQTSSDKVSLASALGPVNRLVGLYRAKTWEYWFRTLGPTDVPAYSIFLLPVESTEYQWFFTSMNAELSSGYPYLKTERWYNDLLNRCQRGDSVPFMLELAAEGRDALARSNLRLAATNFALAVEALFRALLKQYFPDADPTRPSVQLLGTYFARYREIGDPVGLAISKKRALQLVKTVWEPRDELMHGHDLPLERSRIVAAEAALLDLLQLWFTRPGAEPFLIEGPFVEFGSTAFPSRNAGDLIERARNRLAGGHAQDAEEAARFALVVEPTNAHGLAILGVLSARRGQFSEAADLMQQALSLDPTLPGLADDLALVKAKLSS